LWVSVGTVAASGMRSARLPSKNSTLAPLSCTLKAISGICSRVLSGTIAAPARIAPNRAKGELRPVAEQQRDTVARHDAARDQACRNRIDARSNSA
jgi:hypothetical protein